MLSDPQKKAAYDRFGHAGVDPNMGGFGRSAGAEGFGGFADAFGDIFGDIFGAGAAGRAGGRSAVYRGADLRYSMDLTLEQAANGYRDRHSRAELGNVRRVQGRGREARHQQQDVRHVQRLGQRAHVARIFLDPADMPDMPRLRQGHSRSVHQLPGRRTHQAEQGARSQYSGRHRRRPAHPLEREGRARHERRPSGDLYVEIHIKPHDVFQRDGDDLHCEVPIGFPAATLGGEIEVPTLGGKASINVTEGTQTGKTFRLRGKGIKGVRASYPGDLYCHIVVETPVRLTDKQKKLLREFDASLTEGGEKHSPRSKSFVDKMKGFFTAE